MDVLLLIIRMKKDNNKKINNDKIDNNNHDESDNNSTVNLDTYYNHHSQYLTQSHNIEKFKRFFKKQYV